MSLAPDYQHHIAAAEYEIIVVDNGSTPPVDTAMIKRFGGHVRVLRIDNASPSPAAAMNLGLAEARGRVVGVMIDGARVVTPGLVHFARQGVGLFPRAVVAALGFYLGADFQRFSMQAGYDRDTEDSLLGTIGWPSGDGYRLFDIGTPDESSIDGWLAPISESNAIFLHRDVWATLGGVDERFDLPGGGLINLDTFARAMELEDARLVLLLGEATFHQLHGGVSTNIPTVESRWTEWEAQYRAIRGRPYAIPKAATPPTYLGTLPRAVLSNVARSALLPLPHNPHPLGPHFDADLWSATPIVPASSSVIAGLIALAHTEIREKRLPVAAALARFIRMRAPDEPEPQRLLQLLASSLPAGGEPPGLGAAYNVAMGDAHRAIGDSREAALHYHKALAIDGNLVRAHVGLAEQKVGGDHYYRWIDRFYTRLQPETIVEIGVFEGRSLAYARAPTLAIGVDPMPRAVFTLKTNVQLFNETSDEFFDRGRLGDILKARPLGVGFIDGLHLFEQALKDFINLERFCGPRSIILFHDMLPLDRPTQERSCHTQFHTGDVWKTVLCLKHYRPDLDVFTIATPWTGLTVVTGLDPDNLTLANRYEEAVAKFIDTPFEAIENDMPTALNIVANDLTVVEARLKARGIHFAPARADANSEHNDRTEIG